MSKASKIRKAKLNRGFKDIPIAQREAYAKLSKILQSRYRAMCVEIELELARGIVPERRTFFIGRPIMSRIWEEADAEV